LSPNLEDFENENLDLELELLREINPPLFKTLLFAKLTLFFGGI